MTEWEPATEAETAMRDALQSGDQERYFRILARSELLLPVSADALAGRAPIGWGTWTSASRTHLLAFTSTEAMRACLADHAGSARRMPYHELAAHWPNPEWWLAVNPGLPIEGYLPAWFVSQLSRGNVQLPGREDARARDRLERVESFRRARAVAAVPGRIQPAPPEPSGESRPREPAAGLVPPPSPRPSGTVPVSPASNEPRPRPQPPAQPVLPAARAPAQAERPEQPAAPPRTRLPSGAAAIGFGAGAAAARAGAPAPTFNAAGLPSGVRETTEPVRAEPAWREPEPSEPAWAGDAYTASEVRAAEVRAGAARPGQVRAASARAPGAGAEGPEAPTAAQARARPVEPPFVPANDVERSLLTAAEEGSTDSFLSTLLLARVLVPVPAGGSTDSRPGDPEFVWRTETIDDHLHVVVFTSTERLVEHVGGPRDTVEVRFSQLIQHWPDEQWSFALNPGTPVGAKLPGAQIVALANWATEVGLGAEEPAVEQPVTEEPEPEAQTVTSPVAVSPDGSTVVPTVMQKTVPPSQVPYYLERGYDRVSGFVHRAAEVAHLHTPADLFAALGLGWDSSPFSADADEVYVLRWAAYRPSLYRIPYGGPHEAAMQAMQGWVIERAPFRGNGFAPSENGDVIAEFKVDSVRLPHEAELWRLTGDGVETLVAVLDADGPQWRLVKTGGDDA